jgi:hypothetical protein
VCRWRTAPDPRCGVPIELGGCQTHHVGDVFMVGEGLAGERFAAEEAPPALDEVEPGGADGDEGVLDARMRREPVPNGAAAVTGEVVGDQIEVPVRVGVIEPLQQREVAGSIARRCGLRQRLPILHCQRAIDPDFVQSPLVIQRRLDAVAVDGPARGRWEVAGRYRAELVDAEDRRAGGRLGVERDDGGPFGTKSGSLLLAHSRVRRQRTPSWRKMRRT